MSNFDPQAYFSEVGVFRSPQRQQGTAPFVLPMEYRFLAERQYQAERENHSPTLTHSIQSLAHTSGYDGSAAVDACAKLLDM